MSSNEQQLPTTHQADLYIPTTAAARAFSAHALEAVRKQRALARKAQKRRVRHDTKRQLALLLLFGDFAVGD